MEAKEHEYGVVGEPGVVAASPLILSGIGRTVSVGWQVTAALQAQDRYLPSS